MAIQSIVKQTLGYIVEATLEVFSPNHDDYPSVGIQPFEGEPYDDKLTW